MNKDYSLLKTDAYIDGAWVKGEASKSFEVLNPATGELIANVADLDRNDTAKAIEAANAAFPAWRAKTAKERADLLKALFVAMKENAEELAQILTAECGKPIAEARGEVLYGASFLEWFAEEGRRSYGDVIPTPAGNKRIVTTKEPIGVCGMITPWNFPNAMITRKIGPALAAGCTVVLKPAAETPLSATAIAELAERVGFPKGVFNIVTSSDGPGVGLEICESPIVRKVSFTGSTNVGRILMRQSADTIKKLSLELGGNAPFIVFDDADLDAAVAGAMASKYRNSGQTCVCANRFLVQDGIYDAFAEKFAAAVEGLKVGNGADDDVTQGPLISQTGLEKVKGHVADAVDKGAKLITGGHPHALGQTFFEPTILGDVTAEMAVAKEEIFGPVAPLFRFKTEEEAIQMANDTEFGLASYFYSRDIGRVWRVAEALEYGMVGINEGILSTEVAPFGGVKSSGLGREGAREGLSDYLETKYLCMGGI
ncbi:NAD-dependent succinate-semialdehyde dehydrogenase [Kordiimonas sp. SCSIO 12610]|uniref:NAD-dependent succinate-semialdehyde dehydrogenase n=1 Tax=Kordiimonas sp. SCSIO 12610 TaxID=2829597 RepID=UPI00210CB45B|nr:NAD-dependent succinate-semialdehyde dehydrogenase [Kordiimonas sp. SCSIO 12610]UTW54736.1 NAD-dependent succinate-semialdehyde dehydrogenase [Kordiimonas sp. SCSIO 12610]